MLLFWLMWMSLVLGGLVASLWYQQTWRGTWYRLARARAAKVVRSVWQRPERARVPLQREAGFLPPAGVVTRAGPPVRRSTS